MKPGSIFNVRNLQIPPPLRVLQTSPNHTFSQNFGAVFCALRGKFNELGCKIYMPYGFSCFFIFFFTLLLIILCSFPPIFIACYFPLFGKIGRLQTSPRGSLMYNIDPCDIPNNLKSFRLFFLILSVKVDDQNQYKGFNYKLK